MTAPIHLGRRLRVAGFLLLLGVPAGACAGEDLDVTMRMVTSDEALTESVVQEIRLPEPPAGKSRGTVDPGKEGRDSGQSTAEGARETRKIKESSRPLGPGDLPVKPEGAARDEFPQTPEGQRPGGR